MPETGQAEVRPRLRPVRVAGWIVVGTAVLLTFEFILYTTALSLFTHVDTPECAGSDTFCSPGGRPGITGGAVVFGAGNLAAVAIGAALLVLLVLRRGTARTSADSTRDAIADRR